MILLSDDSSPDNKSDETSHEDEAEEFSAGRHEGEYRIILVSPRARPGRESGDWSASHSGLSGI